METEKNIEKIILEMRNETASMRGDEFGIFDYQDLDQLDKLIILKQCQQLSKSNFLS